jgi:hypothetical protein
VSANHFDDPPYTVGRLASTCHGRFDHHHLFALGTLLGFRERYLLGATPRSADDPLVQLHSHLILWFGQPSGEIRFALQELTMIDLASS